MAADSYLIPTTDADGEFVEKKSRFIGHVFRVETEEEALACLKRMREQYWDARHNVYAYIIKDGQTRFSDDGEPGGTAGMPVLEVLQRNGVHQVCCVVTRYFGGTLLGTGGLVRAYGKAAKLALEAAGISRRCMWDSVDIPVPYHLFEQARREINAFEGIITDTDFGSDVVIHALFAGENTEDFLARMTDFSAGRVQCTVTGSEYRDFPIAKA